MPSTYTLISSNVLASSAASVTFSAIPSTYTDLVVRVSSRTDSATYGNQLTIALNGTTTTYSNTNLGGNAGSAFSVYYTGQPTIRGMAYSDGGTATASTFGNSEFYIPNYTSSVTKPLSGFGVSENNSSTDNYIAVGAGLWSGTTAITSITLASIATSANFVSGSSFYLYGISKS